MATSPRLNLNQYLNDLETYQRKKRQRDPSNRVNIPYFRKVAKIREVSISPSENQISIASHMHLQAREKRHAPLIITRREPPPLDFPKLDLLGGDLDTQSVEEAGGGINVNRQSKVRQHSSMLPELPNKRSLVSPNLSPVVSTSKAALVPFNRRQQEIAPADHALPTSTDIEEGKQIEDTAG